MGTRIEFVPMKEAAARVGLSELALRRRVQEGRLPAYENPVDRRRYLIRLADLDRFLEPKPVGHPRQEATMQVA